MPVVPKGLERGLIEKSILDLDTEHEKRIRRREHLFIATVSSVG